MLLLLWLLVDFDGPVRLAEHVRLVGELVGRAIFSFGFAALLVVSKIVQVLIDVVIVVVVVVSLGRRMLFERVLSLTAGSPATTAVDHIRYQFGLLGPLLEEVWMVGQVNVFSM